jgi:hypothetical protein
LNNTIIKIIIYTNLKYNTDILLVILILDLRPEVEGMNTVDSGMEEDRTTELEVVEREPEGVILARHWTDDGAVRHRCTRRE